MKKLIVIALVALCSIGVAKADWFVDYDYNNCAIYYSPYNGFYRVCYGYEPFYFGWNWGGNDWGYWRGHRGHWRGQNWRGGNWNRGGNWHGGGFHGGGGWHGGHGGGHGGFHGGGHGGGHGHGGHGH